VIFIAENGQRAKIRFIVGSQVSAYLWLALLISAALGFVVGFAVAWQRDRRAGDAGKAGKAGQGGPVAPRRPAAPARDRLAAAPFPA